MRERLAAARQRLPVPRRGRATPNQLRRLRRRVAELEKEVQENRRLNRRVAELLDIVEELLVPIAQRDEERIRAYRRAAEVIWTLPHELAGIVASGGRGAVERLPGIGQHLAAVIAHYVRTGEWKTFDEMRPAAKRRQCA